MSVEAATPTSSSPTEIGPTATEAFAVAAMKTPMYAMSITNCSSSMRSIEAQISRGSGRIFA